MTTVRCGVNTLSERLAEHPVERRSSPFPLWNKVGRALWGLVWLFLFRPSPKPFHGWRRFLLRLFGARVDRKAYVHASARIWAPWNLEIGPWSCLAERVDCYCVDQVRLGRHVTVSQGSFLCTASHDYEDPRMPLVTAPIVLEDWSWVCAGAMVAPGVTVHTGAVVGAWAAVFRDVPPWTVVGGNPAQVLKARVFREAPP
jgi:putative colanic acid biosynthesis acetyltransferase WcaF